jgi:hypothetical protein
MVEKPRARVGQRGANRRDPFGGLGNREADLSTRHPVNCSEFTVTLFRSDYVAPGLGFTSGGGIGAFVDICILTISPARGDRPYRPLPGQCPLARGPQEMPLLRRLCRRPVHTPLPSLQARGEPSRHARRRPTLQGKAATAPCPTVPPVRRADDGETIDQGVLLGEMSGGCAPRRAGIGMRTKPGPPMSLANMRLNGVRAVIAT